MQKKAEWENQLDNLTLQYTALMKTNRELTRRIDKLLELCESLSERYLELPDEKKRQLLKIICSNFFYSDSKLSLDVKSAFAALFKFVIFENGSSGEGLRWRCSKTIEYRFACKKTIPRKNIKSQWREEP